MKKFICLFVALTLVGCNGSGGDSDTPETEEQNKETISLQEIDLSGTWLILREDDAFNKANDDYLSTKFHESRILINDTASGVEFSDCVRYGKSRPNVGVKSDTRLYLYFDNNGYEYIDGEFVRSWEEDDPYNDKIVWQKSVRLIKLSDNFELDSGSFSLSAPVEINENQHVCVEHNYSTISSRRFFAISIPTEDDIISFSIDYWGDIEAKTYEYDSDNYDNLIQNVYINDYENTFYNTTGEYYPYLTNGTVTFTEASEAGASGSFKAISQEGHEYSGAFEAIF